MFSRTIVKQSRAALRSSSSTASSLATRTQSQAQSLLAHPSSSLLSQNAISAQSLAGRRWYSSEPETAKKEEAKDAQGEKELTGEEKFKAELEKKDKEIIDLKDRYLRSVAEFRNLQERTKRDIQAARDFALQKFAKDLLDSVDNFDRALSTVPADSISTTSATSNKELISLYDGLKMTEGILMNTLKKHGLERFDPSEAGDKFNPNEHEATFMTPMQGKEDGTVFHTQSKGFKLNGRVLRAAKVGVVKNA